MPNHCHNDLYIQASYNFAWNEAGDKQRADRVQEVLEAIGAGDPNDPKLDFAKIVPYPEEYAARDADAETLTPEEFLAKYGNRNDGFNSGGYNWRISNWGTKWNAYDQQRRDYDGQTILTFQTAWGPPLPVFEALCKKFPDMYFTLEYFERGMAFCGGVAYVPGCDTDNGEPDARKWYHEDYYGTRGG